MTGPVIVDFRQAKQKRGQVNNNQRRSQRPAENKLTLLPTSFPILAQMYYESFLASYLTDGIGSPNKSWMYNVPHMASRSNKIALELSIQAASTAFCAMQSLQLDALQGARAIYGRALRSQRKLLSSSPHVTRNSEPQMVCTAMMLSYFESMYSTTSQGFIWHVEAAARILEAAGPEACSTGSMNELFFNVRTQMLLVTMLTKKRTFFATQTWLDFPFDGPERPVFERLIDILTVIIDCILMTDQQLPERQNLEASELEATVSKVDMLWQAYEVDATMLGIPTRWKDSTGLHQYRDAFAAYFISLFNASTILLDVLRERCGLSSTTDSVDNACKSINDCAHFLKEQVVGCSRVRAILPLMIVAVYGRSAAHRQQAYGYIESWTALGRFGATCSAVMDTIDRCWLVSCC